MAVDGEESSAGRLLRRDGNLADLGRDGLRVARGRDWLVTPSPTRASIAGTGASTRIGLPCPTCPRIGRVHLPKD